jgi:hypothetical protein
VVRPPHAEERRRRTLGLATFIRRGEKRSTVKTAWRNQSCPHLPVAHVYRCATGTRSAPMRYG